MIGNITSKNILYHFTKTSSQPARRLLWTAKSNALPFYVMVLSAHGSVGHIIYVDTPGRNIPSPCQGQAVQGGGLSSWSF